MSRGEVETSAAASVGGRIRPANPPLNVLVDGRVMQDRFHGIGRYTFELLRELSKLEVRLTVLYHPAEGRLNVSELLQQPNVRALRSRVPVASLRSQLTLLRAARTYRPDVIFVPYHLSTPIVHGRIPVLSVMHDCIFERNAAANGRTAFSVTYGTFSRLAVRSATALACPSEASRSDIQRFYLADLPAEAVLPHGVGTQFFSLSTTPQMASPELSGRYILHVGARRPHKNQVVLVKALAQLQVRYPDLGLVLVGQSDPRVPDEAGKLVTALGLTDHVRQYTHADDELLRELYANASVFAFPSLVEGFGMPILEAMAAGIPVVASDAEAVVEAASGAALIVPATMTERWVEALDQVLSDAKVAQRLREQGLAVAASRTWAKSAERTLALLTSVANDCQPTGKSDV